MSSVFGVAVEVMAEVGHQFGRERQPALASTGLGILEDQTAFVGLHE
jgi:hypothetical protein